MAPYETDSTLLSSNRNEAAVRAIRRLQQRGERDKTGMFFAEGVRFVAQAIAHGAQITTLVVAPKLLTLPFGQKLARERKRAGTPLLSVTPDLFYHLSLADAPQGIGAVIRQRWERLEDIQLMPQSLWIAHDVVQSPGNLGTILRTGDAVGADGVILLGSRIDPYDPGVVRATMGALFAQQFVRAAPEEFARWPQRQHCLLVGTSPSATVDYRAVSYRRPVVLLMGGEQKGLSPEQQSLCDAMVRIPMVGRSDSLNLAVATSVMLYEIYSQRHPKGREVRPGGVY